MVIETTEDYYRECDIYQTVGEIWYPSQCNGFGLLGNRRAVLGRR